MRALFSGKHFKTNRILSEKKNQIKNDISSKENLFFFLYFTIISTL